nr:hypothetical protein Iba_scaffold34950CG0180 [Ipomoea batatas]GMD79501.1 hypothetical protein Iba_chr13dCG4510 [Ipomoea batatas]
MDCIARICSPTVSATQLTDPARYSGCRSSPLLVTADVARSLCSPQLTSSTTESFFVDV